ncbi:endonuclease/exonuclease/phosphatase family protein [Tropicimonas sp. S265A]|uniref:endonuclease/exonuclease/phosphatase family protein n=1 Tax=Tropicimonas sp. S265A TaxID=3415134 RepID=UPI003C7C92E8
MSLWSVLTAGLVAYVAAVVWLNRTAVSDAGPVVLTAQAASRVLDRSEISVSTWNLGYGGLGAGSDFVADGGARFFPPSRADVARNIDGIAAIAAELGTDVMLFQEVADPGPLTLWQPLTAALRDAVAAPVFWVKPDVATRLLPWPFKLRHGMVVATDLTPTEGLVTPIAGEPKPMLGLLNRRYGLQTLITEAENGAQWALVNIHLSAFDDGGHLRRRQIGAVFAHAQALHARGMHVVIGGDWNMQLTETDFPHQTPDDMLFWLHPFPDGALPAGWTLAIDPTTPTSRSLDRPFTPGINYTTILDGFAVSPNVEVVSVTTRDTGFEMSDHMPVSGRFRARVRK